MKLQTIIASLAALAPMAVVAEELFNDKYPYCTGCEAKFENEDGQWNYVDHTWCKVNEIKCNAPACEPVDGYPCCSDSSTEVSYIDIGGEWGVENYDWCYLNPLPEFTDFSFDINSALDKMPIALFPGDDPHERREASFIFKLGVSKDEFLEKYEVRKITINGKKINVEREFYYSPGNHAFRIDTLNYNEDSNTVKVLIINKETGKGYLKEVTQKLRILF